MSSYDALARIYDDAIDVSIYENYLDVLKNFKGPKTLLEIGCGTAYLSREASKLGYQTTAIDTNHSMLEVASFSAYQAGADINFYHHDMREPFEGKYGVVVMAVDVVNHLEEVRDVKRLFDHITILLEADGVVVFDFLKAAYMQRLINHQERLFVDEEAYQWSVVKIDEDTIEHRITFQDETFSHRERFFSESMLLKAARAFKVLKRFVLEDRIILVLKKEE